MPAQDEADSGAREKTTSSPVKPKTLLDLPPDLIFQILKFLPTSSAALLSLCNKRFATLLSCSTWNLLSTHLLDWEDNLSFLTLLSRDLPLYHACHGCIRLHLSNSVVLPSNLSSADPPGSCTPIPDRTAYISQGISSITNHYSPYNLRFSHVQLALKRYYHGLGHGIPLSALSHTDITLVGPRVFFFSIEARIVNNEMIVRSQDWILSSDHPRVDIPRLDDLTGECLRAYIQTHTSIGHLHGLRTVMRCRVPPYYHRT